MRLPSRRPTDCRAVGLRVGIVVRLSLGVAVGLSLGVVEHCPLEVIKKAVGSTHSGTYRFNI